MELKIKWRSKTFFDFECNPVVYFFFTEIYQPCLTGVELEF